MNTTITIQFNTGDTREFTASDELEKLIEAGEMYAGNPISALGHMLMMRRNAEKLVEEDPTFHIALEILNRCIVLLSNEIVSYQSGISPDDHGEEHS